MLKSLSVLAKFAIVALTALVSGWAGASVTYDVAAPLYDSVSAPYTTAMRITGSFTLSSALPNNQFYYQIPAGNITSFNFNDGVNAYTASNSTPPSIWVTTDGAGNVTLGTNDAILLNSIDEFKSIYIYQSNGRASTYDSVQHSIGNGNFSGSTTILLAQPQQYTIGGTVSGLANGQSVVLQNNGGDNKTVSASGAFTFATAVNAGSSYAVTVLTQPTGQSCTVSNGSGTANASVTNLSVSCTTTTYTIGGTVTGLASGQSVVLQNNGGDNKTVIASGAFTFATAVNAGSSYAVTVLTQPTGQSCVVTNGSGTASASVTNISVSCAATATYRLTYDANGHAGTVPSGGVYSSGTQVTVGTGASVLWNNHPAKYWNTAANGAGTRYESGSALTMPANDVTLYAQWSTVNVNAQIKFTIYDMSSWTLGLGANDNLGMESASSKPTKHCTIVNIFLCNFDPVAFSLPISRNSPVASNMVGSNMACRYTNVAAPQVPVTIPWTYFPVIGMFNFAYPGSTTIGWTVADSADQSFTNAVSCDMGIWWIIALPQGQMGAYLNTPNSTAPTSRSAATGAQGIDQASQVSKMTALATRAGSPVTYVANCTSPDGGVPVSGSSITNIITISGPTPGKRYQCSFTATDGNYTSPAVGNDNGSIVIAVPTNPTNVVAAPGQGSITLSFGSSSGSGTINYGAVCMSSDGGENGVATGTGSPLTVTGLTPGKSYTCTVSVQDSNGVSQSISNSNGPVVVFAGAEPTAVPTLSEWSQILLMISMIGLIGGYSRRVRR